MVFWLLEGTDAWPKGLKTFYILYAAEQKRGTCIKGLFWFPLEPNTENCFSQFLLIGLIKNN